MAADFLFFFTAAKVRIIEYCGSSYFFKMSRQLYCCIYINKKNVPKKGTSALYDKLLIAC